MSVGGYFNTTSALTRFRFKSSSGNFDGTITMWSSNIMAYIGKTPLVGNFVKLDSITVVNGQAAYTMQNSSVNFTDYENVNQFLVSLNGILQHPPDSFTVSGSTITFASNLSTGDVIDFILVLGNSLDIGTPSDNTVSTAKLASDSVTTAKIGFSESTLTDGSTIDWNAETQDVCKVTLGGNRTLNAPTNATAGQFISILVQQDSTGSRTLTWNAIYEFKDDTAPTLTTTASKGDVFVFRYNGTKWLEVGKKFKFNIVIGE